MAQQQRSAILDSWQQWEGRVVNGRYPLGQYLGGTEQSAVYLTNDMGSKAAIKLIAADASDAPKQLSRWELAAKLSHPHVLRILDVGRWHADDKQDMLFAVMEYADENLSESRRALTSGETRQMLEPALDALRYLHAQGLVHTRLRPANVMAVGETLKLSCDSVRRMGKSEAAPIKADAYDAPERAKGVLAPSGDIWSLGVMLTHVLTYRIPMDDGGYDVKASDTLPSPFDQIVQHCLSRDPEERWSASEIKNQLERAVIDTQPKLAEVSRVPHQHGKNDAVVPLVGIAASSAERPSASLANNWAHTLRGFRAGKQRLILAGAVIAVVLMALIVGLRSSRNRSETNQAAATVSDRRVAPTVAPGNGASAGPPANAPAAMNGTNGGQAAVLHQVLPDVSRRARDSISGTVKVKVKVSVDASGRVSHAALAAHGPSAYFAEEALQAARQWNFSPPEVHGQPGATEWALTFEFRKSGTKVAARRLS